MPNRFALIAAVLFGTSMVHQARGQAPPDVDFLDRLAAQRNAEMRPRPEQPAPVATPQERLRPASHQWMCMSTTPWQPIRSSPSPSASVIGQTLPQIAASIGWVNGFAEVLSYNGRIGYVPSSEIKPYHSNLKPNGTCTVAGLRIDGSPVFALH